MRWFALLALLFAGPALAGVDINTATAEELETLPGIGASKAAAIIEYRTQNGPFTSVDQLDNVSGIGPSTLEALRSEVVIGKAPASDGAPAKAAKSEGAGKSEGAAKTGGTSAETPAAPAASGADASCAVNINTADAAALETLPGIGASKAAAILQSRTDAGPYSSCDDLDRVSGIGPSTIANLRSCCVVK